MNRIICSDGAKMDIIEDASLGLFEDMGNKWQMEGFVCHNKRAEGETLFSTFIKGDVAVYLSYTPTQKRIRQIHKEKEVLCEQEKLELKTAVTPLVTQVRNSYFSLDCGMSYVIRVSDGRFVLIDGGADEYEEADHLWEVILSQYEGNGKPVIAAWFITHPHCDHFGGFVKFMKKYGEQVELKSIFYNWALPSLSQPQSPINDLTEFDELINKYRYKTKVITPRTGQRYIFADATFDILYVCEDCYPEKIPNVNDTSLVMRMELAGRRVLWMGDAQGQASECLCKRYGKESLQCEIFQVGHHGYDGGSDELHRLVAPKVLLWPCPNFWYPVVRLWKCNDFLIHSEKIQATFVSGQAEVVLDMTKPIEERQPYVNAEKGAVIYEEDFRSNRVLDLHWSCITGGSTGYRAATAELGDGKCTLTAVEDAYTVCEFLQIGQIELAKSYELTFSGHIEDGYEKFGLFWNYRLPTVFSEEHALWLELPEAGRFTCCLKADWKNKKADLYLNNQHICAMPYETIGGLHFILKNAKVTFQHIRMIKC